jgi:hypothetical protein
MAELTEEQLTKAQGMTLEELKQLALTEDLPAPVPVEKPRNASGQFVPLKEEFDNSADAAIVEDDPPETKVYRKEIINDDGHVEVYEADSLEDLVNRISDGKRNANAKLAELIAERKAREAKVVQTTEDEEYVTKKNLETKPKQTVAQIVRDEVDAIAARNQRSLDVQSRFVNTHPLYVADPKNGNGERLVSEFQRLHPSATEFTSEGLEKAYSSLAKSGLLVLKTEGADDAADGKVEVIERTAQPTTETTQQRSPRSSGISTRNRPAAPVTNQQPSMDEAYSIPLETLRELANKQLSRNNS